MNAKLSLVIKSGKYTMGYKQTLKALRTGKAKLLVLASNIPPLRRSELEYMAMLANTPVELSPQSNTELGAAVGKFLCVEPRA